MNHSLPGGFRDWAPVLSIYASRIIGKPVEVIWRPFTFIAGEVYFAETGYIVALSESLRVEEFERVFFHEVAHIDLGHCQVIGEASAMDTLHPMDELAFLAMTFPIAEEVLANVRIREAQADLRAEELMKAFEADLGVSLIDLFI